jgi:hypothetical protein
LKNKEDGQVLIYELVKIIKHDFPNLYADIKELSDPRIQCQYGIDEIVFGAISIFLFKTGSRNNFENFSENGRFKKNFKKAFGLSLPCTDAIADVLKRIAENELESIKISMVKSLLEKKTLHKYKAFGKFIVAVDGTGIATFKEKHCNDCLCTESKTGKKTYSHKVLEAKLVTSNGFSISLCTVWIDNEDTNNGKYIKQGCEQKAFVKLAEKLKKDFPRLPICLCADGLYPNNTFFQTCKNNNWDYIVTLRDGNLKGLWKKIRLKNREYEPYSFTDKDNVLHKQKIQWLNKQEHNGYCHNWIKCNEVQIKKNGDETKNQFVYLTNIEIDRDNFKDIIANGRLRWKIEKQGFDEQKNGGYNIEHKYCRNSYLGMKNFYQACQIAHMINQLVIKNVVIDSLLIGKKTINFLWEVLRAIMMIGYIKTTDIRFINKHRYIVKYIE